MTSRKPTVGDVVHYQSYGTPGGEYLPEPRAAIITEVKYIADTDALKGLDGVIEMEGNGSKFIQSFAGREFVTHIEDLPKKVLVSVCVLNPTGMFFNTQLPYAEEPTPGHWNWPPAVHPGKYTVYQHSGGRWFVTDDERYWRMPGRDNNGARDAALSAAYCNATGTEPPGQGLPAPDSDDAGEATRP